MGGSVLSGVGSGVNVTSRSIAHCVDGFLEGILLDSSLGSSVDMLGASVAFTVGSLVVGLFVIGEIVGTSETGCLLGLDVTGDLVVGEPLEGLEETGLGVAAIF